MDVFGDFTNNPATGTKSWHTILTFHTGSIDAGTAAAYAIDITDPASPTVLWEVTAPTTPAANDFGSGIVVAAGPVIVTGNLTNLAVIETNNGGTAGSGVTITAVAQETGAKIWQFGYTYPNPPRASGTDPSVPVTGIPGGAVGVDLAGYGSFTDFVAGDLYGNLWRLNAADGTSRNGTGDSRCSRSRRTCTRSAIPQRSTRTAASKFAAVRVGWVRRSDRQRGRTTRSTSSRST